MEEIQANQLKEATKKLRDKNIRISESRESAEPKEHEEAKKAASSVEEIKKKLKPKLTKPKKELSSFLVLKNQDSFLAERDYELVEEINKSYIEESKHGDSIKDKGDLRQKNLYFSNVGDCPREIYYKFFEPERARDYTVKGLKLFDEGKRHHRNIQRRLEDRGKARNPEGFLEIPSCGATGYYDGLINVASENGWQICDMLEVKSKLPYACEKIDQDDYDQAQLYHFAAQFSKRLMTKRIKVRNIRLLYRDRAIETDDVDFGWLIKQDIERQQQIVSYFQWLYDVVICQKFLSPHPFEKKSKKCTYCRFNEWCWRGYPEEIIERDNSDILEVKLPEKEILDSYAAKLYEILKKESELRKEKENLLPVLLSYFVKTKSPIYPIANDEGLAPKQGSTIEWDANGLMGAIGYEMYAKISKPDSSKITDLINREFVDAAKFERFKKHKLNKLSIYIKKIKGGLNVD